MPTVKMTASIVGSTFYAGAGNIISRLRYGAKLMLKREPDNPVDKNAIAVYFVFSGNPTKLGHLTAGLAAKLAPKLDQGIEIQCTKAPIVGAVVNLEWEQPEEIDEPDADALTSRFKGLS
jgi:hypothetical protein